MTRDKLFITSLKNAEGKFRLFRCAAPSLLEAKRKLESHLRSPEREGFEVIGKTREVGVGK